MCRFFEVFKGFSEEVGRLGVMTSAYVWMLFAPAPHNFSKHFRVEIYRRYSRENTRPRKQHYSATTNIKSVSLGGSWMACF
jgi:hypothetical protein